MKEITPDLLSGGVELLCIRHRAQHQHCPDSDGESVIHHLLPLHTHPFPVVIRRHGFRTPLRHTTNLDVIITGKSTIFVRISVHYFWVFSLTNVHINIY